MVVFVWRLSTFVALLRVISCKYVGSKVNMSCENGVCSREADQGPCVIEDDQQRLFRWEPIKVT